MSVLSYLQEKVAEGPIHLTLLDPEKQSPRDAKKIAESAHKGGTSGIMIGGSVGIIQKKLDETVKAIKSAIDLPVILFPGDVSGVSTHADAIFFMSLLNSRNPYYITGAQASGAPIVKKTGIEAISMGYIVIEPGGAAGYVGDARAIPRNRPEIATAYALATQYLGMSLVYLEAGSGVDEHVPEEMVSMVKRAIDVPLIVGGGIRTKEDARAVAQAGADIIVTGTVVERVNDVGARIGEIVSSIKEVKRS
ncbi:MAG: geranylgeranylglyceryl/heptaprenylglyceryl phosphate synthase [Candidatus Hydrothermarchaeales archaeon]